MSVDVKRYVSIDDFSPGIYSAGSWPIYGVAAAAGPIYGAPVGSAQEVGTYRCVPTADGRGLQPAPESTAQTVPSATSLPPVNVANPWRQGMVTGVIVLPSLDTANDMGTAYIGVALVNTINVANEGERWHLVNTNGGFTAYTGSNLAVSAQPSNNIATSSLDLVALNGTSPYLTRGSLVIAFSYGLWESLDTRTYPNPSTPAISSTLVIDAGRGDRVFAHQNRVVYIRSIDDWIGISNRYTAVYSSVNFTDPPNSNVVPTAQQQVFDPEDMGGIGAYGSLNANTLLLVKCNGGGVVVQGDIANPVVTRVPAVKGTANMHSKAAVTPIGMVYGSFNNGAYVWAGGSNSDKLSKQLRDDFFLVSQNQPTPVLLNASSLARDIPGYMTQFTQWGDYIFTSNNWLYNMNTNSWWRLENPSTYEFLFSDVSPGERYMYVTHSAIPTSTVPFGTTPFPNLPTNVEWGRRYDIQGFVSSWSWHSNPIPISENPNKMAAVDEIIIEAQGVSGSTFTITARGYDGNTSGSTGTVTAPVTVTLPAEAANQPVKIRIPFSVMAYNLIVKIEANDPGGATAPTLRGLHIGIEDGNLVAVQ